MVVRQCGLDYGGLVVVGRVLNGGGIVLGRWLNEDQTLQYRWLNGGWIVQGGWLNGGRIVQGRWLKSGRILGLLHCNLPSLMRSSRLPLGERATVVIFSLLSTGNVSERLLHQSKSKKCIYHTTQTCCAWVLTLYIYHYNPHLRLTCA